MVSLPDEVSEYSGVPRSANTSSSSQGAIILPVQRIKMIMKSCPDVETVQQESLQTIAKATELFIGFLANESYKKGTVAHRLDYDSLSEMVQSNPKLEFLMETIPNKITWAQCQRLMAEKQAKIDDCL